MRIALGLLMALHGAAHLVGFVGSWQLGGPDSSIAYKTTVLAGKLDIGQPGVRAMGIFWLLTAAAFWVASAGALMDRPWWLLAAFGVSLFSLLLCVVALPDSRIGIAVNLLIIALLLGGQKAELFTSAS